MPYVALHLFHFLYACYLNTLTKHVRELYIPVAVTSTTPQPSFVYIKEYYLNEGL